MSVAWTWRQAVHRRLRHNHLLRPAAPGAVVDVVSSVCGVQAQVPAAAELCVATRTDGLTRSELREAFVDSHAVVRTYAMRGTAYLLASRDLPTYLAAMRQLHGGRDEWFTAFGLDAKQAHEAFGAVADILDGRVLSRQDLVDELRDRVGSWFFDVFDPSLAEFSVVAAYAGVLAYGPSQGAKTTFVRPDQWCPGWHEVDEGEALRDVVYLYAATYGPVTHNDVARWLAITAGSARDLLGSLHGRLSSVDFGGKTAWLPTDDLAPPTSTEDDEARSLCLLPQYDCYILGSGPIDRVVPAEAKEVIRRRNRGRYEGAAGMSILLIDGIVAGVWERQLRGKRLDLVVVPVRPLTDRQRRALETEANRIADFVGARLALSVEED